MIPQITQCVFSQKGILIMYLPGLFRFPGHESINESLSI